MDLPPSGWYPDPYGAPDLLRWWDGSTWTHHTHPGVGAEDGGGGAGGAQQTTVQPAGLQAEVAQTTVGRALGGQALGGQALGGQASGGGWATRDRVIGDWAGTDWPSGDLLANTKPPKGPRTEPQPALPDSSVQPTTHQPAVQASAYQRPVQPTVYQPAVSSAGSVGATTVQPAGVQPAGVRPDLVAPTTVQPSNGWGTPGQYSGGPYNGGGQGSTAYVGPTAGAGGAGGAGGTGGGDGTQVLFLGNDAWQVPGGPGGPGGPNRYGYQQAQQRRRLWLIGGLVAGTAVAIAIIVVVATSLGGSHGAGTADQAATRPAAPTPTAAAATPTPAPTASTSAPASASVSATAPTSVLSDGQSGLSYAELATPWTPICPSDLNGAFPWTAGESAVAGQINGGQTAWYGEACSGPLPAQYNYSKVGDLENTATNVAQTLENAYYNALNHTIAPELSEPVTVSGHPGWEIEYLVTYANAAAQGATWTTEEGAVVVTDTGTGNAPAVFFTSVPDTLGQTNVASLVSSLQLTVVPAVSTVSPPASVTPPPSVTPTAAGSPTTTLGANP